MKRSILLSVIILLIVPFCCSCQRRTADETAGRKLRVVTTIFPVYDFTRQIAGDRAEVTMLLPPGMEPHSFEPKPEDIFKVGKADLFVFTDVYMEPWAEKLVKGIGNDRLLVVDSGKRVRFLPATGHHDHGEEAEEDDHDHGHGEEAEGDDHDHGHGEGMDPHIWLDFANAQIMVDNIAEGLAEKDPANRGYYLERAEAYKGRLAGLDEKFRKGLSECASHLFIHGGHYAFGYLAARYGLDYRAAYAVSANAEPTPRKIAELVNQLRESGGKYIFYEELLSPVMAQTIARETGATLLRLNGAHNVSKKELDQGVTFIPLMEENLESLRKGLQCR